MHTLVVKVLNPIFLLVLHSMVISLVAVAHKVEATVVMVLVISPAGLLVLVLVVMASLLVMSLWMIKPIGHLNFSLVLVVNVMLMLVLLFESTAQILSELFLLSDVMVVRLQVREGLVELTHEDAVVGFSEVGVVIATKLVVAVDHVADAAHHPLDAVHGAHAIGVTVHHSDWCVQDVLDWDVGSDTVLLALQVRLSVLLEATLNTHLEVMGESTG